MKKALLCIAVLLVLAAGLLWLQTRRNYDTADTVEENGVLWQSGELGKVDGGGGGTVAMYIANLDVDVIDVGVPVLSMHAPYEIVAKIDVYMAYKAFTTFFTK